MDGSAVFRLFEQASALPPGERAAFLAASAESPETRARVEAMLRADAGATPLDARAGLDLLAALPIPDPAEELAALPTLRGSYRIVRPIGEGGSGAVYEAEQLSPRRKVAIKALRPGLVSARAVRRLRAEADILARLNHPGIARVFEAGVGEEDQPGQAFIVMELIRGEPITAHAARANLSLRDRVALMLPVCEAVEHAHQRAVIHRDLKPANILVDDQGRPIVLDFGVARVVDADARRDATLDAVVGTLAYMSPEQASGSSADADVRADVYALGAILYELTCGRTPVDVSGLSITEALRAIESQTPRALSSVDRSVPRDLGIIVARALEKDPDRRFPTVGAFADDLRRFLEGRAIQSRRQSTGYVVARTIGRHKFASSLAALFVVTLAALVVRSSADAARFRETAAREGEARTLAEGALEVAQRERQRVEETSARLEAELARSVIDRGRLEARSDNKAGAEAILWSALFADPSSLGARGALWELFEREECLWAVMLPEGPSIVTGDGPRGRIMVGNARGGVTVLAATTGETLAEVPPPDPESAIKELVVADDGSLWVFHASGVVRVVAFDAGGARIERAFEGAGSLVGACLGSDGRFATVHEDGSVIVRSMPDGSELRRWVSSHAPVRCVAFLSGGRVATGSDGGTVEVWTDDGVAVASTRAHEHGVVSVVPDGDGVITAGIDHVVRRWDAGLTTGEEIMRSEDNPRRVARGADGSLLLHDGGRVWVRRPGEGGVRATGYTNSGFIDAAWVGASVVTIDTSREVRLWSGVEAPSRRAVRAHDRWIFGVDTSPDGLVAVTAGGDGIIRFEDAGGSEVTEYPLGGRVRSRCVRFSADGRLVAAGCSDGIVRVFDVDTRALVEELPGPGGEVYSVAFSADGSRLTCGTWARAVRVWSVPGFEVEGDVAGLASVARGVVFSKDGARLYASGASQAIAVIDAATHAVEREIALPAWAWSVAISPDGRTLAAGLFDASVCAVDLATDEVTVGRSRHRLVVAGLDFSADGRVIASGGDDGTVRLWEADGMHEILRFDAPYGAVPVVRFAPGDRELLGGTAGGYLVRWDLRCHDDEIRQHVAIERARWGGRDADDAAMSELLASDSFLFGRVAGPVTGGGEPLERGE